MTNDPFQNDKQQTDVRKWIDDTLKMLIIMATVVMPPDGYATGRTRLVGIRIISKAIRIM